ncbi:hypothetical protein [Streptomyces griseorubiginosus]|uniref:hypothetical protein n=1 Tax=Streptomyces griseorubiginosus TaxID=67304 RepID=UPI0036E0B0D4
MNFFRVTLLSALLAFPVTAVASASAAEAPTSATHVVQAQTAGEPAQMKPLDNWAWD